MINSIHLNEIIYPHVKIEEWPAPDRVTAQRWVDEMQARGTEALILDKWNGYEQHVVVQVAYVVTGKARGDG